MAKTIYRGFINDPNDPVFKRGWTVTLSPASKKNSEDKLQEKKPPELTTQIETEGEGVPQTQNLEPQVVEETKEVHSPSNTEKFFAINKRAIVLAILVALLMLALALFFP